MGTSTVHRSPGSPHWRVVNNLYGNPNVEPSRLLAEVFRASAEPYSEGLSGPETLHCVDLILRTFATSGSRISEPAALQISRSLLSESRLTATREGWSHFYGDMAHRAMHATVLSAASLSASERGPENLVRHFLGNLLATCVDHVVSRDLSAHLGERTLRTSSDALKLSAELKTAARNLVEHSGLTSAVTEAARRPSSRWAQLVTSAWKVGAAAPGQRRR